MVHHLSKQQARTPSASTVTFHRLVTGLLVFALCVLCIKDFAPSEVSAAPGTGVMPGESGLLTPAVNPPALTYSAANAGSTVPNALYLTETSPFIQARGAHLTRSIDSASARPDSITPVSAFQTYSVEIKTDSTKLDVRYRGTGVRNRIWVNGHPISISPTTVPTGGAFYRTTMTFSTREMRTIRYESDATTFTGFTVSKTDQVVTPPAPTKRAIIIGDSFTEGTGANGRFNSYGQTLCLMAGWDDCWVSGSGGTGYINDAAGYYPGRTTFRNRIVHDALMYHPEVIVIAGGKNDGKYPAANLQAESLALFKQIRQALPLVELIVVSPMPSTGPQAQSTSYASMNQALKTSATGLADYYLDITGANAYMTGTGYVGKTNGSGNSDVLTSADGVHPSPLGHDTLAKELFKRYEAQRQVVVCK